MSILNTALNSIGAIIEDQIPIGENKNHTLDIVEDGKPNVPYGKLGDFANKIDMSATRKYYEQGFTYYNSTPKSQSVLTQTPEMTVYIKKKFVSSISNNYRTDLMSKDDKLFLKASKVLFRNKCRQIGAYEKLFKISKYAATQNRIEEGLLTLLTGAIQELQETLGSKVSDSVKKLKDQLDRVNNIKSLSQESLNTSWVTSLNSAFSLTQGERNWCYRIDIS